MASAGVLLHGKKQVEGLILLFWISDKDCNDPKEIHQVLEIA